MEQDDAGEIGLLAQVSNEMGRVYKDQFGRGGTRIRSDFLTPDVLVVVLEESLTAAERTLVEMGEHERLREQRVFMQYATKSAFVAPIERLTGRTVRAFVSGIDTAEDVSTETFVLHPAGASEPSRAAR